MTQHSESSIEITDPFARRLLTKYLQRRESDVQRLRVAVGTSDFKAIELAGHNLFGSGAAYGLEEISVIGEKLEIAAKSEQAENISKLIDALDHFVSNLTVS